MTNKGRFVFLVILTFLSFTFLSCKKNPSEEKKQVVLYCSTDQSLAEPIIAEFEKISGLKVLARYDTEASKTAGLVQRIRAEVSLPAADVFWSSEIFHTIRLAKEGLLAPYTGVNSNNWPEGFVDDNNMWYGFGLRVRVIAYNTNRVKEKDAPSCLEDVLDARWKGRILMARPEFGTTSGDVSSWFVHYGEEQAKEILNTLKTNDIRLVDGNSTAVRMVASGQGDICFTDTDDVYAAQRNSWPVKMKFLDQNGEGALAIPNTAAIVKGGPNPENAKVLMEFLLSERLEELLVESDSHNSPIHPDLAEKYREYSIRKPLIIDYYKVAENLPLAIKTAGEILY